MKNRNKDNKSRLALIGMTSIATLLMFYFGFNYLKGINAFSKSTVYYMTFPDVGGLDRSSSVILNGYRVGKVRTIDFDYKGYEGAVLELAMEPSLKIPTGTIAKIKANPLGGAIVQLMLPENYSDYMAPKDTIVGLPPSDMLARVTDELIPNLNNAILMLDTLITGVDGLVSDPNIRQALVQINASTKAIQGSTQKLDQMMDGKVPQILGSIDQSTKSLASVSDRIEQIDMESVIQDFSDVVGDLKKISNQLNNKDNSLGLLLNDQELYERLNTATHAADSLLNDIRKNPKRYVHFSVF